MAVALQVLLLWSIRAVAGGDVEAMIQHSLVPGSALTPSDPAALRA
eukprot:CAMPEP_0179040034 /NCGR_PEP_ID=MMETSP0796-20121207/15440_1 /TAXON_ID=73915 /ORGANISM="Pyrodinium bahamense, Strain pbaha01" /LENGTH=45 /DNA_ID= /DNA_START= /DNA_END= /DNA_ORIENTATION=